MFSDKEFFNEYLMVLVAFGVSVIKPNALIIRL